MDKSGGFFFLMTTSDFATSYTELSLHRLRTLFSRETSIILTLNAVYNETYIIQTLISIHLQYGRCCGFINMHRSRNW